MVVPAATYALANAGAPEIHGCGVPMSTDTAFALGLLALLGRNVPISVTVFVAALAIDDVVGAILIIPVFYAENISPAGLVAAAVVVDVFRAAASRAGKRPYIHSAWSARLA